MPHLSTALSLTLLVHAFTLPQEPAGILDSFSPSIDPSERTAVLVLGTPHLAAVAGFRPEMLEGLLEHLERWGPDAICVEALPGRAIHGMLGARDDYGPVLEQFAADVVRWGAAAQEWSGLDRLAAEAHLRRELETDSGEESVPRASSFERAAFFLAAYDLPSALLHWSVGRASGADVPDDFPPGAAEFLDARLASPNEVVSIGVALASRLGLTRLDSVDDHADKDAFLRIAGDLSRELAASEEVAAAQQAEVYLEGRRSLERALEAEDLLPHYHLLASAGHAAADVRAQWDLFLRTGLASGLDRARLALWDLRNLNMAAHVRRATARVPGGRVLVLVGAGHRPFLEAHLGDMLDVRILSLREVVPE